MKTLLRNPNRVVATVERYQRLISTFSNWPLHLGAKWGWLGKNSIVLKTRSGWEMEVPWPLRHTFKEIFMYQSYVRPEILASLPTNPVIFDVGGNVGFFSLLALHLRPGAKCLTFEPMNGNFAQLQSNQRRNPRADWHVFHAAVAADDGKVQLCSPTGQTLVTDAFIQRLDRASASRQTSVCEPIQARTLESIFREEGIQHCDWLKFDCEGAEYEIIYGAPPALFDRISRITMETHFIDGTRNNTGALADYLERLGYHIWWAGDLVYAIRPDCVSRPLKPGATVRQDLNP